MSVRWVSTPYNAVQEAAGDLPLLAARAAALARVAHDHGAGGLELAASFLEHAAQEGDAQAIARALRAVGRWAAREEAHLDMIAPVPS